MDQTIGEVARRTGVTERTLRYYEELGLLTPRRDAGGRRLGELQRQRERVRSVEERLMSGQSPTDQELVGVLTGLPDPDATLTRRTTLLVYADIERAHRHLVDVFGFAPGALARNADGKVVHGEVYAGDGVIWMHREAPEFGLASPATLGAATHCMAVQVDDLDAHAARVQAAGGEVVKRPEVMDYGVREYSARDSEGGLWSFMEPLDVAETID